MSFEISVKDHKLVGAIVKRAKPADALSLRMDLTATHANGNPMDFARLLAADDFNFWHDIRGIERHLDRETGKLQNLFSPRFSTRVAAS